jgi:8-oxo-dGTP pyrophosphatase MutT (NUDIX family)
VIDAPETLPQAILRLPPVLDHWPFQTTTTRAPSAVVVLFLQDDTSNSKIVLIRRSARLSSHRGQVGLPGGRMDATDISPLQTALRELEEELGVPPSEVQVLGQLPSVRSIDGSLVYPVVAVTSFDDFHANASEVDAVYIKPWINFTARQRVNFNFNIFGCWRNSWLFNCDHFSVWGLTAEILASANLE